MSVGITSFWHGPLGAVERICMRSMLAAGHPLTVYAYGPLDAPDGVCVKDAREIIPSDAPAIDYLGQDLGVFADIFRYELMRRGAGVWCDLDVYVLRPLVFAGDRVFGWEKPTRVNTAVLRLPSDCPVLHDLLEFVHTRPVWAPFWRTKYRLMQSTAIAVGRPMPITSLPKASFGPKGLTYFLTRHHLLHEALAGPLFYPVAPQDFKDLLDPSVDITQRFTAETVAVHLWSSQLRGTLAGTKPHPDSYIGRLMRQPST